MGGEPTFIAANDMDAPEWNTDALGPTKRAYAGRLIRRLMDRWTPGRGANHSMGKQYPGEQLPRWALHCHWRADGETVWNDPALLASDDDTDNATAAGSGRVRRTAWPNGCRSIPALVIPAYEDIHYYLWKEQRLPANVLAEDSKLKDPLERARLARVFGQGLASNVGSVLPLRRVIDGGVRRWQSGKWFFKAGEMFLIPGDSPLGLRLPLEALPWVDPEHAEFDLEPDPFAPREKLPSRQALQPPAALGAGSGIENFRPVPQELPVIGHSDPSVVRTALAVEARDGMLHVFFPPLYAVEDWLALTAAVEETAGEIGRKVVLEGYLPPEDDRLLHFSVTPDPGVIEVNIHPDVKLGGPDQADRGTLRGSPAGRPGDGKVQPRRPPCRHRRRQPCGDGRGGGGGFAVPAPPRPAEIGGRVLAQPPQPVVSVQRPVHRPDQPASSGRRGAAGQPGGTGDRVLPGQGRTSRCRLGSPIGCSATSWRT